jgi:hypothetical protein
MYGMMFFFLLILCNLNCRKGYEGRSLLIVSVCAILLKHVEHHGQSWKQNNRFSYSILYTFCLRTCFWPYFRNLKTTVSLTFPVNEICTNPLLFAEVHSSFIYCNSYFVRTPPPTHDLHRFQPCD